MGPSDGGMVISDIVSCASNNDGDSSSDGFDRGRGVKFHYIMERRFA